MADILFLLVVRVFVCAVIPGALQHLVGGPVGGAQLLLVLLLPGGHRAGQLLHLVLHNVTLTVRIKYYSAQSYLQLSVLPVDVLCLRLLIQS